MTEQSGIALPWSCNRKIKNRRANRAKSITGRMRPVIFFHFIFVADMARYMHALEQACVRRLFRIM